MFVFLRHSTMIFMLFIFLSFSLLTQGTSTASGRTALIIGNGHYINNNPLKNTLNDVVDMNVKLESLGFNVIMVKDGTKRSMRDALVCFKSTIKDNQVALFYFSGHGLQVKGINYLIPVDARITSESDVEFESINTNRILAYMEDGGCPVNILILDACRSNPFEKKFRSTSGDGIGLAPMQAIKGSFISYATAPGSVASDGFGRNGAFTKHLLLNIGKKGLKIEEIFKQVRIGVVKETANRQLPWESSSLVGDFYFAGNGQNSVTQQTNSQYQFIIKQTGGSKNKESDSDIFSLDSQKNNSESIFMKE